MYPFSLDTFRKPTAPFAPNTPAPKVVFTVEGQHDSHGMVALARCS